MDTVKLSSTGQLVIPKAITDTMHLLPDAEFVVKRTAAGLLLAPKILFPATTIDEVRGCLAKPGRTVPDEETLRARIAQQLKEQDDLSKE